MLVFDASSGREELVWSFEPRDPSRPSLQILPVPSKPEVSTLAADALDELIDRHPAFPSSGSVVPSLGPKKPAATARTTSSSAAKLSWKIFAPTELEALRAHLAEQKHPADDATSTWLDRLALRGFHFVAVLRPPRIAAEKPSEGPATSGSAAPTSASSPPERVALLRLRFATPAPYFPYSEPAPPKGAGLGCGRSLSVWSILSEAQSPIAVYRDGEHRHWVRPWRESAHETVERASLRDALGPALAASLPRGGERWVVQRFVDQKSTRDGFGEVLLVPRAASNGGLSDERLAKAVGIFDASLEVAR